MPTDERVLGFSNRWYPYAAASAMRVALPSGTGINLITAPAFLATKFEAFQTRGKSDPILSLDFEDIINVVEGRQFIVQEVGHAPENLKAYLADQFTAVMAAPDFENILPGLVAFDALHAQRTSAVKAKLTAIAALS